MMETAAPAVPASSGKDVLRDIVAFARNPTPERWPSPQAWRWFWPLCITHLLIGLSSTPIVSAVRHALHTHLISHQKPIPHFFSAVIFAPLLEELAFRLPMRFGKWRLLVWVPFFAWFVLMFAGIDRTSRLPIVVGAGIVALVGFAFLFQRAIEERAERLWNRFFPHLVWFLTLLFGVGHIHNYDLSFQSGYLLLLVPLLALPQLCSGWLLAFARVRFGLPYSIALHASYNGSLLLLTLLPHRH